MHIRRTERGAALIGAVLIIVILSLLGTVSLNVAVQEVEGLAAAREDAVARHLAEAGTDLVLRWFHDPSSVPDGPARELFRKQGTGADGSASFFNAAGQSPFTGTPTRPDLLYEASRLADDRALNDPSVGWFRALGHLGRITRLAVYAPTRPGLLCTVEVTAATGRLTRTVAVQLGVRSWPPIRAGVQLGVNGPVRASAAPLPVSVHWGDLVVNGDVHLGAVRDIPVRTELAAVTGQAYGEMAVKEDRWLDLLIGGAATFTPSPAGPVPIPANVHVHQEPAPGLRLDRWDYQALKEMALREGAYYVLGQDGLLYRDGLIEPGAGITPTAAVRSAAVGDHRGLVFVDTLDRASPQADNLGTVTLDAEYMEGLFIINAHLRVAPAGRGNSVPVSGPLSDGQQPAGLRGSVSLTNINIRGALITPGDLALERPVRVYGAVVVGGGVIQATEAEAHLEVWYDQELDKGLMAGLPLVYQARGTWRETYGAKRT